jgi:hypothetical protein
MNISYIFHCFIPCGGMLITLFSLKVVRKNIFFIAYGLCSYEFLRRKLETALYVVY